MQNKNFEQEILREMEEQYQSNRPPSFREKVTAFYSGHKWHSIFLAVLIILTAIACVPMHSLGDRSGMTSLAKNRLQEEIDMKTKEFKESDETRAQINTTISNLTQAAAENGDINVRMKENEELIAGLTAAVTQAQTLSDSLDKQLEEKKKTSSQINSITNITPGITRTLQAGDYRCPNQIKAGTYKITGESGNILLYDISNSIRVSKNLGTLDGNEFTLTISDGEKLKVDKTVKITAMN